MNNGLKQRLVGALVLTAIAVIFLPSLFTREERVVVDTTSLIPPAPDLKSVVISKPARLEKTPEKITAAPTPEQAFQPKEEVSPPTVVTEIAEPPSLDTTGLPKAWTVQVASFIEPTRAEKLRDKLLADDYHAYSRELKTDKGEVTRVFIGPQISRQSALEIKMKIDKALSVNSLVLKFQP